MSIEMYDIDEMNYMTAKDDYDPGREVTQREIDEAQRRAEREGWIEWIRTKADLHAAARGCWFHLEQANYVCEFFETFLRHSKGRWAGMPFKLADWQKYDVLMPVYGWKRPNGSRRYRIAYIEVAKKNGKSTLCSGLALYGLLSDGEMGAEVYSVASDVKQASIVYNEAKNMVRASYDLSAKLEVVDSTKRIIYYPNASYYRVMSSEVESQEGYNASMIIFDELHAQKNKRMWHVLRYSGLSRWQQLLVVITTAGIYDKESICWVQHQYTENVMNGIFEDDSRFGYIRGADQDAGEGDEWKNEEQWKKANPGYGISLTKSDMIAQVREVENEPSELNTFLRYRLNIWVQQETRWLSIKDWDACESAFDFPKEAKLYGGLDLAATKDLNAFAMVGEIGDKIGVKLQFYLPEEIARKRQKIDNVPYMTWASQGWITLMPGKVSDYAFIRKDINLFGQLINLTEIGYDPWNATQLVRQLEEEDGFTMVLVRQGYPSMNSPSKEFEKMIISGRLIHDNNPVLRWCVSNVVVKTDSNGNKMPDKEKSKEKIDGVVAAIIALSRLLVHTEKPSVYEERGVLAG